MNTDVATIDATPMRSANPMDMLPTEFRSGLARRQENRKALMQWIREQLVDGVDYGVIQTKRGPSKPSLRKPGAEKICGMLGVTATFPTLKDYEGAALEGREIRQIILRCHLIAPTGEIVADGVGARTVEQDYGDLNKALKMTIKSAHIDATLRMAGLSEIFTQDLEDMPKERVGDDVPQPAPKNANYDRPKYVTCGKHKGKPWADIAEDYLNWCIGENTKAPRDLQIGAMAELKYRQSLKPPNDYDEDLPESAYGTEVHESMRL